MIEPVSIGVSMRHIHALALPTLCALVALSISAPASAQVAKEILGTWSGDPNCSRIAMRHVFSEKTFEWVGDGRRYYLGEAAYEAKGGRLTVTLTKDIDRPFQAPDAPKAGDILTYQRIGDGWRPYSLTRGARVETTPPDTPTFRRCAS